MGQVKEKKRPYEKLAMLKIPVDPGKPILADSAVNNSMIMSVGQEVGPAFDYSDAVDSYTGKTFTHEWDQGN